MKVMTLLLLAMVACAEPVAPRATGEHYTLATIAGQRPPVKTGALVYWSGSIELRPDSTFIDVIVMGTEAQPTIVDSVFGRYRVDADSIRMTPRDWTPYAIARAGDVVQVRWEAVYEYRRDR